MFHATTVIQLDAQQLLTWCVETLIPLEKDKYSNTYFTLVFFYLIMLWTLQTLFP
jgi:hypothetical protein